MCSSQSEDLAKLAAVGSSVEPLGSGDIDLLAERFEVGGRVDYLQFLSFFRDAGNLKTATSCASPFRYSSDWSNLKKTASSTYFL